MTTWTWLIEPLPLDVANTCRWADGSRTEYLREPADLSSWLDVVRPRLPRHHFALPETLTGLDLRRFHDLRDVLIDIFGALGEESPAGPEALEALATTCLAHPVITVLDQDGPAWAAPDERHPAGNLLGLVAAESVSLLSTSAERIALCRAPGCHWLYLQSRPNQRWCRPECGNRARVSRHQHRHAVPTASRTTEGVSHVG